MIATFPHLFVIRKIIPLIIIKCKVNHLKTLPIKKEKNIQDEQSNS